MKSFLARMLMVAVVLETSVLAGAEDKKDIVDTAVGAGSFKTLVAALKAADLVETLKGEGPFTVFAPTDVQPLPNCPRVRRSTPLANCLSPRTKTSLRSSSKITSFQAR
jgi:hypothetical protein